MLENKEEEVHEEAEKLKSEEEKQVKIETVRTDAEKHKRLQMEKAKRAEAKERFRDFVQDRLKHDRRLLSRRRREKYLGGTRGRRGG